MSSRARRRRSRYAFNVHAKDVNLTADEQKLIAEKQNLEGFIGALKDGKPAEEVKRAQKLNDVSLIVGDPVC